LTISYWQDKSPAQLTIYNLRGQKIYEQSFAGGQNSFVAHNLHLDLPNGVYLFSLVIKGERLQKKVSVIK
ncbi:MAG: T9SS type A sorting domain-containing protein, partial [Candidatus Cloacimonas sp.]|nr:T9SS type A sorting domain-containing protein [Candidatus Cloacimonas sp.]